MCGLAVAIDWPDPDGAVRQMIAGLQHRGEVSDPMVSPRPGVAMATRRLPIVDPAGAVQPQLSADGRLLVAFNGEIFNHIEIRRALEAEGLRFRTGGDTEVLASALSHWGPGAVQGFNGMFAFVAINLETGGFLAGRDPMGVKPLYLLQAQGGLLLASEIRPLLEASAEGEVLFLPPGGLLTRERLVQYGCRLTGRAAPGPLALDDLLSAAVEARIPPDLPVAALLSGGVDSTLITHYLRRARPQAPAYVLGADGSDDLRHARAYADRVGLELRHTPFEDEGDLDARISAIVAATESFEPDLIRGAHCSDLLARRARRDGFKVLLSGEGADELFAGYAPLEIAFAESDSLGVQVRDQHLALMHRNGLQRLDRCGMRHQVEIREPFLDPRVVSYARGLGARDLIASTADGPQGKAALRALFDLYPERLPTAIRDRAKAPMNQGAGLDDSHTRSPWRRYADSRVSDAEFADGQRRFADYDLRSKEAYVYLCKLAETMAVARVPHLKTRLRIAMPAGSKAPRLDEYRV